MNTSSETHPRKPGEPIAKVRIPCRQCSTPFAPKRPWQKFCSTPCRRLHHQFGGDKAKLLEDLQREAERMRARMEAVEALERRIVELERLVYGLTGRAPMPVRGDGA